MTHIRSCCEPGYFADERIAAAPKRWEPATPVAEPCRRMGVRDAALGGWPGKHGGLGAAPTALR